MKMRIASALLAFVLLLTGFSHLAAPVSAAYENIYSNTGNQAADIIGVALTQVGYQEGSNNYTKYGVWYGLPNAPWCGMFVAWCANQAGIPTSVIRKYAMANPTGYGLAELDGRTYRPKPGDLFFKRSYSHVGIVYYLEGDYFYTLEGNTGAGEDRVMINRRKISDYLYGSPSYNSGGSHSYTTGYDSNHPHKEYKQCSHCGDKYYTGNTKTVGTCLTCIQNNCVHNYGSWQFTTDSHSRECSLCGRVDKSSHNWNTGTITQNPTCAKHGYKDQTCNDCGAERTVSIAKTDQHQFDTNTYIDEQYHTSICSVCNLEETKEHSQSETWLCDESFHWYECSDCKEPFAQTDHRFTGGCESACEICKYQSKVGHSLEDKYQSDEISHWLICKKCDSKVSAAQHQYAAQCDETCDACGFIRTTEHTYDDTLHADQHGHWKQCSICGKQEEVAPHIPDSSAQDWQDQACSVCAYIVRSATSHEHAYDVASYDANNHWGKCRCGQVLDAQPHSWSMKTQTCSVCGASNDPSKTEYAPNHTVYWIAIGAGGVAVITTVTILCVKLGKKKTKTPA